MRPVKSVLFRIFAPDWPRLVRCCYNCNTIVFFFFFLVLVENFVIYFVHLDFFFFFFAFKRVFNIFKGSYVVRRIVDIYI